ncbi:MAG: acyltransferase [Saprospiraceae bacterium]|nr:acyltransferase [Saprospiraceae bacterium]
MLNTILQHIKRPTPSGATYLAEVDGLRFVAIFLVIIQHLSERMVRFFPTDFATPLREDVVAFWVSRGTVGVFLFFAISGFVLALPFTEKSTPLSIKSFYSRRLTRIEPPYLIWMSVFALILVAKDVFSATEILPHWLASVTYTNWFFFGDYSVINPVAWSLEIEIQFYLIAPFLAKAYFSIDDWAKRRLGLAIFIGLYIVLMAKCGWLHFPMKATLLGRLPNFLIGFLVADLYKFKDFKSLRAFDRLPKLSSQLRQQLWDIVAIAALFALFYTWTEELVKTVIFNLALFLLFVAAFKGFFIKKMLKNNWIAAFGGMCYTIYLTHLPLLEGLIRFTHPITLTNIYALNLLLQAAFALPIIGGLSIVFYIFIEKPFMRQGKWRWPKIDPKFSFPRFRYPSVFK